MAKTVQSFRIREARVDELDVINPLITRAIDQWHLTERVKRLVLPSYHYKSHDLEHTKLFVAFDESQPSVPLGVAALEVIPRADLPDNATGLLLHGLYVDPQHQRSGLGRRLFKQSLEFARAQGVDGLLVKARPEAVGFFQRVGMQALAIEDERRDYAHRFWSSVRH